MLANVFGGSLPYMAQISEQKLIAPLTVPEAAAYPAQMKSDFGVTTDTQFYIAGWNTNLVEKRRRAGELRGSRQLKMEEQFNRRRPGLPNAGRVRQAQIQQR